MPQLPLDQTTFFLGGADLEMVAIRELLADHAKAAAVVDRSLSWGAAASDYVSEIQEALSCDRICVLVELKPDLPLDYVPTATDLTGNSVLLVDHHNERASATAKTSLEQVMDLLKVDIKTLPNARHLQLVSANDRGHVAAMLQLEPPATVKELQEIRALDRQAQGVTSEDEQAAEVGIRSATKECSGRLTVVRIPSQRTSPVTDRLDAALGGPGFDNLLVVSPGSVNFFGDGQPILALRKTFPDSWSGGQLPTRGFWGSESIAAESVLSTVRDCLGQD